MSVLTNEIKHLFDGFTHGRERTASEYHIGSPSRLLKGKLIDRTLANTLARISGKSAIFWLVVDHQSRMEALRGKVRSNAVKELNARDAIAEALNRGGGIAHPGLLLKLVIQRYGLSALEFGRRTAISTGTLSHVLASEEYLSYEDCVRVSLATMNAKWYWVRLQLCHRYQNQIESSEQNRIFLGRGKVGEIQKYISASLHSQRSQFVYPKIKYAKVPGLYLVETCARKARLEIKDVMTMLSLPESFFQRSSRGLDLWDIAKAKKLFGIDPVQFIEYQVGFFSNRFSVHRKDRLRLQSTFDTGGVDFSEPNEVLKKILLPMGHNLESLSQHLGYPRKYLTLLHSTKKTPVNVIVKIAAALRMPVEFWSFVFLLKRIRLHSKLSPPRE